MHPQPVIQVMRFNPPTGYFIACSSFTGYNICLFAEGLQDKFLILVFFKHQYCRSFQCAEQGICPFLMRQTAVDQAGQLIASSKTAATLPGTFERGFLPEPLAGEGAFHAQVIGIPHPVIRDVEICSCNVVWSGLSTHGNKHAYGKVLLRQSALIQRYHVAEGVTKRPLPFGQALQDLQ